MDQYDPEALADDEEIVESYEDVVRYRNEAERELDLLDARRRQLEDEAEEGLEALDQEDERELQEADDEGDLIDDDDNHKEDLETFQCPLREWVVEERTRREIQRRFRVFLMTYYPGIEKVNKFLERHQGEAKRPPLPADLKITPPIYVSKIRYHVFRISLNLNLKSVAQETMCEEQFFVGSVIPAFVRNAAFARCLAH